LREVIAAGELLEADWGAGGRLEHSQLHGAAPRGLAVERRNMLHPERKPEIPYVTQCLDNREGP